MSGSAGSRSATAIVLFTDVVGSTELRTELGDDRADEVRRGHDQVLRDAISARGGVAVKGTGDGVMAVFDAAAEAIAAGTGMQQATRRYSEQSGVGVDIRVGISAGDVSWEGTDCFGTPVVEAARLCGAASGGQVLVSEIVRLLAGSRGGHTFASLGSLELKGLAQPVATYEVSWQPLTRPNPGLPRALDVTEAVPFVGRDDAFDTVTSAWKEAASDRRGAMLVSGEPGIGKTRLVCELARAVHADGATVLFGRCDEDLGVPYQPFAEALGAFVEQYPTDHVRDQLGPYAADLARLVPELSSRLTRLEAPLRAEPETERYRLFEAFDLFLATTSAIAPVLLILDDLHWAEQATLLLLRHLARSTRQARVLVLGTYRDTDLGRGHPLAEMLADLRREPSVERLDLHGLGAVEVAAFMEAAAGHTLDEAGSDLARRLHTETEGNPFFVGQVLRSLTESGALVQEGGRWVTSPDAVVRLPEGVREVIGRRLTRLPDATLRVLELAAVMGRQFDTRLLVDAAEVDREGVLDALERAEEAHLIEGVPGLPGRYAFVHALVRSTLAEELATTRRLRLHRRIGEALESRQDDESVLPELARHFAEAASLGEGAKAARYGVLAAQAAWRRLAYEDAAQLCEQAMSALDPGDPAMDAALAALFVELQTATAAAGERERTLAVTDRAVAFARRAGRPDVLAQVALSRNGWRSVWADAGSLDDELVALLEEAIDTLPADAAALHARCRARLAVELYFDVTGAPRREALVAEAEAIARDAGDRETLAFVLSSALYVRWRPGVAEERLAAALELDQLAADLGAREIRATNIGWMAGLYLETLRREEFDAAVMQCVAVSADLAPVFQWAARLYVVTQTLLDGRFLEAEALAEQTIAVGTQWEATALQMYGVQLLTLRRALGGLEELEPLTLTMVEQFPLVPAWRTGLCLIYSELERIDDARAQLEILATDDFASIPYDSNWLVGIAILALTTQVVGDERRSAQLYDLLLPHANVAVLAGSPADCLGSTSAFLALAAAGCGRWDDWERHLADARRHHEQLRSPSLLARLAFDEGRVCLGRNDAERAHRAFEHCLAHARPIGMTELVRRAEALLANH